MKHCPFVRWPGLSVAYLRPLANGIVWNGTILEDKRDAGGTHYRRNRNYDPASGRFTQEDPIGLAGGLNLYGFAGGDPVDFSDPFGTCPAVLALAGPGGTAAAGTICLAELATWALAATLVASKHGDEWPYHPRPGFRKGTTEGVEGALTPGASDNTYVCPTCGKTLPVRNPDGSAGYDRDHTGKSWAERILDLKEKGADRGKVRDEYQKDVRGRCPSCNRGDNKRPEKKPDESP